MLSLTRLSVWAEPKNLDLCRRQTIFVKETNNQGLAPMLARLLLVLRSGFSPAPILFPTVGNVLHIYTVF